MEARRLLNPNDPMQPSQEEVGKALGMSQDWVSKYETLLQRRNVDWKEKFLGYNIWGFKDDSWRDLIASAPDDMPDKIQIPVGMLPYVGFKYYVGLQDSCKT